MEKKNALLHAPLFQASVVSYWSNGKVARVQLSSHPLPAGELQSLHVRYVAATLPEVGYHWFPTARDTQQLWKQCPSLAEDFLSKPLSDFSKRHLFQMRSLWCT